MAGLNFPAQLLVQWATGCNQARTLHACIHLGVFPDPLVEEIARVAVLVAGVLLVRAHRSARLSDLLFWAVCLSIGMYFVAEALRYGATILARADQRYLLTGVVAAVGLWLILRRGWWPIAGVPVLALGMAWSPSDHESPPREPHDKEKEAVWPRSH